MRCGSPTTRSFPAFEADATALRQRTNCWGEFKWTGVHPRWLGTYQDFLRLALSLPDVRFTSIVIDTDLMTDAEMTQYHGAGGRHEAYLKFMRLLLSKRIERWVEQGQLGYTLLYDRLSVKRELAGDFRTILLGDMTKLAGRTGTPCHFHHLAQVNSATSHLMQATDMLTGASWSAWMNENDTSAKKPARDAIRSQIEEWAGGKLTRINFGSARFYSAWKWRPGKRG